MKIVRKWFSFSVTDFTTHDIDRSVSQQLFTFVVSSPQILTFPLTCAANINNKTYKKYLTASYTLPMIILTTIYNNATSTMQPHSSGCSGENHGHFLLLTFQDYWLLQKRPHFLMVYSLTDFSTK